MLPSYHSKARQYKAIPKENWDRIDWSNNKLSVDPEEVKKNNKEAEKANKHLKNYDSSNK